MFGVGWGSGGGKRFLVKLVREKCPYKSNLYHRTYIAEFSRKFSRRRRAQKKKSLQLRQTGKKGCKTSFFRKVERCLLITLETK